MRIEIEPKDVESIVHKLVDLLKPLIASLQRECSERTEETGQDDRVLMDVEGAAEYLGVKCSWVYDRTRKKEIPHENFGVTENFENFGGRLGILRFGVIPKNLGHSKCGIWIADSGIFNLLSARPSRSVEGGRGNDYVGILSGPGKPVDVTRKRTRNHIGDLAFIQFR